MRIPVRKLRTAAFSMVFVTMSLFTDDLLAAKNWPENGVRGVTTKLIAK